MLRLLPHTVLLSRVNLELNGEIKTVQEHAATIYKALLDNTRRGLIKVDEFASSTEEEQATAVYLAVLQELASDSQTVDINWIRAARSILPPVQQSLTASLFGFKPNSINVFTRPADVVGTIQTILNQLELSVRQSLSEINELVKLDLCVRLIKYSVQNMQHLLCARFNAKTDNNDILYTQFINALKTVNEKYRSDPEKITIIYRSATNLGAIVANAHLRPIDEIFAIVNSKLEANPRYASILQHYTSYGVILSTLDIAFNHVHLNDPEHMEMARELVAHLQQVVAQIKIEAVPTVDEKLVITLLEMLLPHVQQIIANKLITGPALTI